MLGYKLERDNSEVWTLLGLNSSVESIDKHTPTLLRSRINTLRFFTSKEATRNLPELDRRQATLFYSRIQGIETAAGAKLANLKKEHEKLKGIAVPQWLEPSAELATFLDNSAAGMEVRERRSAVCMTFLSNVQETQGLGRLGHTADVSTAREFYSKMRTEKPEEFTSTMANHRNKIIYLWAPSEQPEINVLHRGLQAARKKNFKISLCLLVPFQALPCSWEYAKPFIRNPFSDRKWNSYITESMLLEGSTRCVFSGALGPLHQLRNIAIYRADTIVDTSPGAAAFKEDTIVEWRSELANIEEFPQIIVDFAADEAKVVEYSLTAMRIEGLIGWSPVSNSRGSSKMLRRKQIVGYFEAGTSSIHLETASRLLKSNDALTNCMIASGHIFDNPAALIADVADSRALTQMLALMEQCAMVTPRKALLTTHQPDGVWAPEMTEKAKIHRLLTISKIAHRDGRPFAAPHELPSLSRIRAHQEERAENPELFADDQYGTTTLSFDGAPPLVSEEDRDKLHLNLVARLAGWEPDLVSGDPYAPLPPNDSNSMRFVTDHRGYWNGRIKFTFNGLEGHEKLHKAVHGSILGVGNLKLTAETAHSFIRVAGNTNTGCSVRKTKLREQNEETYLKCALRSVNAASPCEHTPCPVCDAPGGDRHEGNRARI